MIIDYVNNGSVVVPQRANPDGDLGYDLVATEEPTIVGEKIFSDNKFDYYSNISYIEYKTSLFIEPKEEINWRGTTKKYHTLVFPRSSISKTNLTLLNSVGIIDSGYKNQVMLRFGVRFQPEDLNFSYGLIAGRLNKEKIYKKGDRIGQLVVYKNIDAFFNPVEKLSESSRGVGGFGSSGV
jgi:dUTPase